MNQCACTLRAQIVFATPPITSSEHRLRCAQVADRVNREHFAPVLCLCQEIFCPSRRCMIRARASAFWKTATAGLLLVISQCSSFSHSGPRQGILPARHPLSHLPRCTLRAAAPHRCDRYLKTARGSCILVNTNANPPRYESYLMWH